MTVTACDAVIVGAGFGGLRMLWELRSLGLSAAVLEEAPDVGGTWYWNRYPGARTDSEAWSYCFSFSNELLQEWDWSERYCGQAEILRYLRHVADRFNMRPDIRFNARVTRASYDDSAGRWEVVTAAGEVFHSTFFIPATGPLSRPVPPPFEGLDDFAGEWYLTARWPAEDVDFRGKRVGIVGTGSTGVQVVPIVAEVAREVVVFQRTPNYVIRGGNRRLTAQEWAEIKSRYDEIWKLTQKQGGGFAIAEATSTMREIPVEGRHEVLERAWEKGGFHFLFQTFRDLMVDEAANELAAEFIRTEIRSIVKDPAVAELLCPRGYPLGAKRPPVGHSYYEAFNRDNVRLVDVSVHPVERIIRDGLRTAVADHPLDVLIFATGFDGSTGAMMAMDVRGRDGRSLNEHWSAGPRTYLGVVVDGFPNMFMISGPQSPFGNIPIVIENCVRWIGRAIEHAAASGTGCVEAQPSAVDLWVRETADLFERSLVRRGAIANSWFVGANVEGKPVAPLFYFGRADAYFRRLEKVADQGFRELLHRVAPAASPGRTNGSEIQEWRS
ncbi:MAG TPA: NAD(P)/FAD-dependent oxidoreductase [Gemmatimonadales bacterium]|jgi:cation diffusion facilitator CzcD-associated flavoprotein CzcO|nr:NAD(P)/FAD-dependent oxidoreductase [Gemmatimonadales bacterium]